MVLGDGQGGQPALGKMPVVFCTGRASGETEVRAAALNAGTLFKPFSMDVLAELAETYRCHQRGEIPPSTSKPFTVSHRMNTSSNAGKKNQNALTSIHTIT